ncbi:Crp/Fnr family transcriptional regulator [Actinocorallia libanotica]|uniref:Crp/Fnr family transcriptional regulator n=1 Tax=Actinocorallia libanotica TaxID=46162 RepID=A0ABN1S2E4_9ACTN
MEVILFGGFRAHVGEEVWARLLASGTATRFYWGDVLLSQGEQGTHVLLLTEGSVKVMQVEPSGRELLLAVRSAGEILGEFAVLEQKARRASAIAIDHGMAFALPAPQFTRLMSELDLSRALCLNTLDRYRENERFLADLADYGPGERVARCIARLSAVSGPLLPLTHEDLAKATCLSRSTVSLGLSALKKDGLLATEYGCIRVLKPGRLLSWRASRTRLSGDGHSS